MKSLESVFSNKQFDLPLLRSNEDYLQNLKLLYGAYISALKKYHIHQELVCDVEVITTTLIGVVQLYYKGLIYQSYSVFSDFMKTHGHLLTMDNLMLNSTIISELSCLYRTRVVSNYRQYTRKEIFHVPFNLRTAIEASRYSIAGYPSLYLSTSVELCHYESSGAHNDSKIYAKFTLDDFNKEDVVLFDCSLRPQDIRKLRAFNNVQETNYIKVYPLLAAASFSKANSNQKFVPEYIIGQFLLEWLRSEYVDDNKLVGIRYFSSRSQTNSNRGYNYVFPTSSSHDFTHEINHCTILSSCWKLTEPLIVSKERGDLEDFKMIIKELNEKSLDQIK